jgi:hypothetical protein
MRCNLVKSIATEGCVFTLVLLWGKPRCGNLDQMMITLLASFTSWGHRFSRAITILRMAGPPPATGEVVLQGLADVEDHVRPVVGGGERQPRRSHRG